MALQKYYILPIFLMETENNFECVLSSIYILQHFEIAEQNFKFCPVENEEDTQLVNICLFTDT